MPLLLTDVCSNELAASRNHAIPEFLSSCSLLAPEDLVVMPGEPVAGTRVDLLMRLNLSSNPL